MDTLAKYYLPKNLIFWNLLAFVIIKFVFSSATFQLANVTDSIPLFDSRDIIAATNTVRAEYKLPVLSPNYQLDLAAQKKLEDMATKGYFAHVSPEGVTPWYWIKNSSYTYLYAGENLAVGFFSADETVQAWLESPSHRDNILNKNYKDIGVAVGRAKLGDEVAGILVVQMFGSQKNQPAQANKPVVPASTPKPTTTVVVAQLTPSPLAGVGQAVAGESKEPAIALQYVSTDQNTKPVAEPIRVEYQDGEAIKDLSAILNNAYLIYAFIITILSVLGTVIVERNASGVLKTSLHAAIFLLALFTPALGATLRGIIY